MSINKIKYDELEEMKGKNEILINLLNKLIAFDKKRVFLYPVNVELVPDYLNVIKEPMDFTTMKQKIQNFKYNDFNDFEKDVYLIINNCYTYNDKSTIYHRIAENLENYYKKISIKMHKKFMNIHFLYHKDKNILNNTLFNANANNVRKSYLKEKKKNEKTKKYGKVGRPSKLIANSKNNYVNNSNEIINASNKKKRINSKILSKGVENIYNFVNNIDVSSTPNFVNNIYENINSSYLNLENMIEEENFSTIINKIQDSHDKSNDIFHLLIKMLSNNTSNHPILCNYVNINKSLREIFFEDTTFSKIKNYDYLLSDSDDVSIQSTKTNRKRELPNISNIFSERYKKNKLLNETQHNNYNKSNYSENNIHCKNDDRNHMNNKDTTENSKLYPCNNHDNNTLTKNNKNLNENHSELNNDNDDVCQKKHIEDTNDEIKDYILKKRKFVDERNKMLNETITCNIEKEELTMNLLNYKESVKKFIGESNFPTFIKIFPNIYTILDNTDVKDLYYSAFNDLRIFGLDMEDFIEFNNKIVYNDNYLLGVGKYHINNIFTLDKKLSNILSDDKDNSHFSDKLKAYLSNNKKHEKSSLLCYNYEDNKYSVKNNNTTINDEKKKENEYMFEMKSNCENTINKNCEYFNNNILSSHNNNDLIVNKLHMNNEGEKEIIKKRHNDENSFNNENILKYEHKLYDDFEYSCESSSDDENLNLKNFFYTYNSYLNEFYKEKKRKKILNNKYSKSYKIFL
ncbi:bromodomain protein, putative [Plasmodium gallinaceum]|uniref:Bromodomain protein, putative n=1 Tax=Plasmodium gallinaceum TaxID=5849 RepID=A0A1J1GQJ3_PLAGA|nr:bromodomain protein, putative [Plasmodium gallinaceum]CRG94562.1 bromodomain protein, putative [Plasmodium gallinaceum]